ncbi:hypothetical protein [Amycolatopsis cihanbeyliensis]|uniref:Uncharacterized protein n=1 Tax=Amycolatopsis cihanbeyliensis TaxID=1128664 RepID=A0A542DPY6_AMYCI|nr:hypothetical protein [Amycolatopsis cihanbeyliensis]TQJ05163.1 hypothetical protein FB471_4988 [Amycolatopsis cihanbeyliensis]
METSYGRFVLLRPVGQSAWSAPARLVQVVRRRRRLIPSPGLYLLAAAVGSALGLGTQLLFDWPWWLFAAGFVAAVAVFFLSTAFWGPDRTGVPLAEEWLWVLSPRRAHERQRHLTLERFRSAPFALYGLPPHWPGDRYIAGWASAGSAVALGLGHGEPGAEDGPRLHVEVRHKHLTEATKDELAEQLWLDAMATAAEEPLPDWSTVTVSVEARPVTFEWLAGGRHWAALAELDGFLLILQARDFPIESVELERVTDLERYPLP